MPAAPPARQKSAALTVPPPPPTAAPTSGQSLSVLFSGDSTKVGDKWHAQLAGLAKQLETNREMRLQLLAYAGGASLSASQARRRSLIRALAVRQYLIKAGVRSTRIDVRALGDKAKNESKNRVDVTVVGR
jgi:outer membrane protein OmpA-like peptidoglycan-associated protein